MQTAILMMMNLCCALGRVTVTPQNAAVVAGERLSMECQTDGDSRVRKWILLNTNQETMTVYTHLNTGGIFDPGFAHFGVHVNDNGSGILYADLTRMEDAGNYTCIARVDDKDVKYSAQLIVFETEPICETNFTRNNSESLSDGDYISMRCSISFRGFWTPTFEWRQHGGNVDTGRDGKRITANVEVEHFPNSSVIATLSTVVDSVTNGSFFSCKISFVDYNGKGGSEATATNPPNFNYTWESHVIHLSYSPMPYYSPTPSLNAAIDVRASVSTDELSSRGEPSSDRYFNLLMMVAGLSLFLVLVVVVSIAFCIHYKRKVSAKYSTSSALDPAEGKERPSTTIYEIIPYSVADNYETIDEIEMHDSAPSEIHPTPDLPSSSHGYSGLLAIQPTPPAVYSRMDHHEEPSNADNTDQNAGGANISAANKGDSPEEPKENITSSPYLELTHDSTEKNLVDVKTPAYLNIANDALDETVVDSGSNSSSESPKSYINVSYETPQMPVTLDQGLQRKASDYTCLLATGELRQSSPDIPIDDHVAQGIISPVPQPPPRRV